MYKVKIAILEKIKKQLVESNKLIVENTKNPFKEVKPPSALILKASKTFKENEKLIKLIEDNYYI